MSTLNQHLVLLGDSIFDNAAYIGTEPDVITHLQSVLPAGWMATLCAVDGSTTGDLETQLPRVPEDASHLVVSIGGNDAILNSDLLETPVDSTTEALELFHDRIRTFEVSYRQAVERVLRLRLPTAVCTIYNGNLPDPRQVRVARVGPHDVQRRDLPDRFRAWSPGPRFASRLQRARRLRQSDRAFRTGRRQDRPGDRGAAQSLISADAKVRGSESTLVSRLKKEE